jgi:hypothetical protein
MWLAGELFAIYLFLWTAFGKELISVQSGTMAVRHDIFGYGRERRYQISKLENLRASGHFGSAMSWSYSMAYYGISGGSIAFEYEGKTRRLGIGLKEGDANKLVAYMKDFVQ